MRSIIAMFDTVNKPEMFLLGLIVGFLIGWVCGEMNVQRRIGRRW